MENDGLRLDFILVHAAILTPAQQKGPRRNSKRKRRDPSCQADRNSSTIGRSGRGLHPLPDVTAKSRYLRFPGFRWERSEAATRRTGLLERGSRNSRPASWAGFLPVDMRHVSVSFHAEQSIRWSALGRRSSGGTIQRTCAGTMLTRLG